MRLTLAEVRLLLELIREKYGPGYADSDVGRLQAKLSVMGQLARDLGDE